jgi:O-methyltransferase involved in polyketide biosynthesis
MDLSQVSRTAILTLICRAIETEKHPAQFNDPMAVLCLEGLKSIATEDEKRWIIQKERTYAGIQANHAKAGARRARIFDDLADRYIAGNPNCTVINLACGFDTRFWRIENDRNAPFTLPNVTGGKCKYIELDLPEVINLKKEILKDQLVYEVIGGSVLDTAWIDQVTTNGNTGFLLLAEGLFDWLPQQDGMRLLREIGARFTRSQLVLDKVLEKYTRGIWKFMMRLETRLDWGLDVTWASGIKIPQDIEAGGNSLKVIGEEKGSAGPIITVSINAA